MTVKTRYAGKLTTKSRTVFTLFCHRDVHRERSRGLSDESRTAHTAADLRNRPTTCRKAVITYTPRCHRHSSGKQILSLCHPTETLLRLLISGVAGN